MPSTEKTGGMLACSILPLERQHHAAGDMQMLGLARFSTAPLPSINGNGTPTIDVPMQSLLSQSGVYEYWEVQSKLPVHYGQAGLLHYSQTDELLFGAIALLEIDDSQTAVDATPLQQAAAIAYRAMLALADRLKFPHLLRCWNYFADINGVSHGIERYRQFNLGRQQAFLEATRGVIGNVPAACALGFEQGPLIVYFLAGRTAPRAIENARQVSAYRYPDQYGPRPPTFSRANLIDVGGEDLLFISGTASIVGHETMHAGDVAAQTKETLVNIGVLVAEANRQLGRAAFSMRGLQYKVYVRYPNDVDLVQSVMKESLGPVMLAVFFRADICRADLLVEIEATGSCVTMEPNRTDASEQSA